MWHHADQTVVCADGNQRTLRTILLHGQECYLKGQKFEPGMHPTALPAPFDAWLVLAHPVAGFSVQTMPFLSSANRCLLNDGRELHAYPIQSFARLEDANAYKRDRRAAQKAARAPFPVPVNGIRTADTSRVTESVQ